MSRIRFEDTTPINKGNLDKLNNVVISSTEPTTGEEVWIEKGKNLFDKSNVLIGYGFSGTNGEVVVDATYYISDYIPIKENISYYISGGKTGGMATIFYDKNKEYISGINILTGAFETPQNVCFVRVNGKISELNNSIQIVEGTQATEYEDFIRKIHIKNDNGVYEEFYSKEHDTGWIDMSAYVASNFAARDGMPPMARRIGNKVYWRGFVYSTTDKDVNNLNIMVNLPDWCKPAYEFGSGSIQFEHGNPYYMFIIENTIIVHSQSNINATSNVQGFGLSNISGYLTD